MSESQWWNEQINPWDGCNKISPACLNCYAAAFAKRFWKNRSFSELRYFPHRLLNAPMWRKPRHVFVCNTSDIFHPSVEAEWFYSLWAFMTDLNRKHHAFVMLTKRPGLAPKDKSWWDYDNFWLGVTAENQHYADERIPELLKIPAKHRFVSFEPLLEPIDMSYHWPCLCEKGCPCDNHGFFEWAIIGCESGIKRRRCDLDWVRNLVHQLKAVSIQVFVKQLDINGKCVRDINQFPEDLRIREYPKW